MKDVRTVLVGSQRPWVGENLKKWMVNYNTWCKELLAELKMSRKMNTEGPFIFPLFLNADRGECRNNGEGC